MKIGHPLCQPSNLVASLKKAGFDHKTHTGPSGHLTHKFTGVNGKKPVAVEFPARGEITPSQLQKIMRTSGLNAA